MKKLVSLCLLCSLVLFGCSNNEDNIKSDAEVILDAIDQFSELESYHKEETSKGVQLIQTQAIDEAGNTVYSLENQKINSDSEVDICIKGNYLYNFNEFQDGQYALEKYEKHQYERIFAQEMDASDSVQFLSYMKMETYTDFHELNYIKDYIKSDYKEFFAIKKEKKDDNTVYTIECTDLNGFQKAMEKNYQDAYGEEYDPLQFYNSTVSKNQIVKRNVILSLNENKEIIEVSFEDGIDYGDGLKTDTTYTAEYSKFNEIKLNFDYFDELLKQGASNELQQGDVIDIDKLTNQ